MMAPVLRRVSLTGLRKGMSGSRVWLIVGIAAGGLRILRYLAKTEPEVLYRTVVRPGDVFEVVTRPKGE